MSTELIEDPKTCDDFCRNVALLAAELGVNNKMLGLVLPNLTPSRVSRIVRDHKADTQFAMDIQYAYHVLLEAKLRGALPITPRSSTPTIILLIADMIVAETKFAIMTEQHGNPYFDDADDLSVYEAIVAKTRKAITSD